MEAGMFATPNGQSRIAVDVVNHKGQETFVIKNTDDLEMEEIR